MNSSRTFDDFQLFYWLPILICAYILYVDKRRHAAQQIHNKSNTRGLSFNHTSLVDNASRMSRLTASKYSQQMARRRTTFSTVTSRTSNRCSGFFRSFSDWRVRAIMINWRCRAPRKKSATTHWKVLGEPKWPQQCTAHAWRLYFNNLFGIDVRLFTNK